MSLSRRSLQFRFLRVVAIAAACFGLVIGVLVYRLGHRHAEAAALSGIETLQAAVEKTAAIGAYSRDEVLLREVVAGLARNPLVASVSVLSGSGEAMVGSGTPHTRLVVDRPLMSPFDPAERLGTLRVSLDTARMEQDARGQASMMAAAVVGQAALVALVIYVAGARLVSRPIVHLAREMQDMAPGSEGRLAMPPSHADDEIGMLVKSANELLELNESALRVERSLRLEIQVMEAQYRQIFDSTSAGIFVLDREGRLINGNPTVLKVIGLPGSEMRRMQGRDFLEHAFARPQRVREMIVEASERRETVSADLELRHASGMARWVHCLISVQGPPNEEASDHRRMVEGVMYDVTERRQAETAVRHRAEHDALTGLKNRAASDAAIDRFIGDADATGGGMAVLYIDLDGFKAVNDRWGHKAGDQVLVACAQRLLRAVKRASDLVGRLGGDEFVVGLGGVTDNAMVEVIARQVLAMLSEPIQLDSGEFVQVGASIGVARYPEHGRTRRHLMQAADAAMYEVKRRGKRGFALAADA